MELTASEGDCASNNAEFASNADFAGVTRNLLVLLVQRKLKFSWNS